MYEDTSLNSQKPEGKIAIEVWTKLERGLNKAGNRLFSIQFCVSNIAEYIGKTCKKNDNTEKALSLCAAIILGMGWDLNFAMKQARVESIFTKFILEAAKDKESDFDTQRAQHEIALKMNCVLLQNLAEYINEGNEYIRPIYEKANELRTTMLQIFKR